MIEQLDLFEPAGSGKRTRFPVGHVIHHSLDHKKTPSDDLVECDCGWSHRVPWIKGSYIAQDEAIEAHWRDVETRQAALV